MCIYLAKIFYWTSGKQGFKIYWLLSAILECWSTNDHWWAFKGVDPSPFTLVVQWPYPPPSLRVTEWKSDFIRRIFALVPWRSKVDGNILSPPIFNKSRAAKIALPRGTIHFNKNDQPCFHPQQIDVATTWKGCAPAYVIAIFRALCCVTSQKLCAALSCTLCFT